MLGAVLVLNPFRSLAVLLISLAVGLILQGVGEWTRWGRGSEESADGRGASPAGRLLDGAVGLVWVAGGVAVLAVPALTVVGLAVFVGVALTVGGTVGVFRAVRTLRWSSRDRDSDRGLAEATLGLAAVCLGVAALVWPDVTVFALAAVFGVRLAAFGAGEVVAAIRRVHRAHPARRSAGSPPTGRRRRGFARTVAAGVVLVMALGLLVVGQRLSGTPVVDAFYAAPDEVPAESGRLLRAEPFTRGIPEGAQAWRILYTTTAQDGRPALSSGLVVVPEADAADADGSAARPVVAWAHGTTGFATPCAPSLLEEPFEAGAFPDLEATLERGWAVVATDYTGLGSEGPQPYLIGRGQGYSVLDSVRAARQLTEARLGEDTVVWGHSQGGHAALWAGGLAAEYAPELELSGVAALAPAANLSALMAAVESSVVGPVFGSFALTAYAQAYPEVRVGEYVRPGARIMVDAMSRRCLSDPSTLVSLATSIFADQPVWARPPTSGPLLERAEENVPVLPVRAPLLIGQGAADTLVTATAQREYV